MAQPPIIPNAAVPVPENMLIIKNKNAFSLVEIVVASVIFTIAAVGLFSVFSMTRGSSDKAERRLQAAYAGKQLLEELYAKVDRQIWQDMPTNPDHWQMPGAGDDLICDDSLAGGSATERDWPYGFPSTNIILKSVP